MKIDNKAFLCYLQENCITNLNCIKAIRFNNKSISVKLENKPLVFNDFFTEKTLYNTIIGYLSTYIKENDINYPSDIDYLTYQFSKLNIN